MRRYLIPAALIVGSLSSCSLLNSSTDSRFPGFIKVPNSHSNFFIDPKSLKETDGAECFRMLQVLPEGYAIQNACVGNERLVSAEGLKYTQDGTPNGKFDGVEIDLASSPTSDLAEVAKFIKKEFRSLKSFAGDFQDSKALSALFGNYRPDLGGANRKQFKLPTESGDVVDGTAKVFLSEAYQEGGINRHLVLTRSQPSDFDCHICYPLVDAAIFVSEDGKWQVENWYQALAIPGTNGEPAICKWEQNGKDSHVLVSINVFEAQGEATITLEIFKLQNGAVDKLLEDTLDGTFGSDNSIAVKFEKSNKETWDMSVLRAAKSGKQDTIRKYRFSDNTYQLVARLPEKREETPAESDKADDGSTNIPAAPDTKTPSVSPSKEPASPTIEESNPAPETKPAHAKSPRTSHSKPSAKAPRSAHGPGISKPSSPGELDTNAFMDH